MLLSAIDPHATIGPLGTQSSQATCYNAPKPHTRPTTLITLNHIEVLLLQIDPSHKSFWATTAEEASLCSMFLAPPLPQQECPSTQWPFTNTTVCTMSIQTSRVCTPPHPLETRLANTTITCTAYKSINYSSRNYREKVLWCSTEIKVNVAYILTPHDTSAEESHLLQKPPYRSGKNN